MSSGLLKLSLIAGLAMLIGLHLPSPWRSAWPGPPAAPWEEGRLHGGGGGGGGAGPHHHHAAPVAASAGASRSKKVNVAVFGESLCPDTTRAIRDVIWPLFSNGVAELMDLHYFAYGKVQETAGGLQCQHGEMECKINRFLNCAQELHPNQTDWFPYAACVHGNSGSAIEKVAAGKCAEERGWKGADLVSCATGELGAKLEKKAQEATKSLGKLTFVPWILVNGVPIGRNFDPLAKYVCAAAGGEARPEVCTQDGGSSHILLGRL